MNRRVGDDSTMHGICIRKARCMLSIHSGLNRTPHAARCLLLPHTPPAPCRCARTHLRTEKRTHMAQNLARTRHTFLALSTALYTAAPHLHARTRTPHTHILPPSTAALSPPHLSPRTAHALVAPALPAMHLTARASFPRTPLARVHAHGRGRHHLVDWFKQQPARIDAWAAPGGCRHFLSCCHAGLTPTACAPAALRHVWAGGVDPHHLPFYTRRATAPAPGPSRGWAAERNRRSLPTFWAPGWLSCFSSSFTHAPHFSLLPHIALMFTPHCPAAHARIPHCCTARRAWS